MALLLSAGIGPFAGRAIDRWGHVADGSLHANSLIPLLRSLFAEAGVESPEEYSSHSMRRGFAGWARASGWDIKELMEYVGWKDVKSAMRYLDASDSSLQARFEQGLPALASAVQQPPPALLLRTAPAGVPRPPAEGTTPVAVLRVTMVLARFSKQSRGLARGHRLKADRISSLVRSDMLTIQYTGRMANTR
mgnify:CR=1 FL=1